MMIELASGLFALGGVALTALFGEVRARREVKVREAAELTALKRKTYGAALQQVELVASKCARWVDPDTTTDASARQEFWDALVSGYQIMNEINIMSSTQSPGDAMKRVLTAYRRAVENEKRELPKPREDRQEMFDAFREDLGLRRSQSLDTRHGA